MRNASRIALISLLSAAFVAGCGGGGGSGSVPSGVVAVVGEEQISRGQLDELIAQAERTYAIQKRDFPKAGSDEYQSLQTRAVDFLVQRSEYAQEAAKLGINVTTKQIEERLAQYKKQYFGGNDTRYRAQLKAQGLTDAQFRQDIEAQLIAEAIADRVAGGATVTDQEIKAYYESNTVEFTTPRSRQIRHILVKTKKLAGDVRAQLEAGGDFAALARKYSEDPGTKSLGGLLTISEGETVKPFGDTAFALKTGEISDPVKTEYGWHVIYAEKPAKPRQTVPLAKVKSTIRQQLLEAKRNDAITAWISGVKDQYCNGKVDYATGFEPVPDPCQEGSDANAGTTTSTP
jgi:foldase protein PrsA